MQSRINSQAVSVLFCGAMLTAFLGCGAEMDAVPDTDAPPQAQDLTGSDYGSEGTYEVGNKVIPNPARPLTEKVHIFYPKDKVGPSPTLLFIHGFGGGGTVLGGPSHAAYTRTLTHFASRGYTVVFPTQMIFDLDQLALQAYVPLTYRVWWKGIEAAAKKHGDKMDLNRIGVIGHSLGGGAVPWVTKMVDKEGWGDDGLFMVPLAPWYAWLMSDWDLKHLPKHAKYLGVVFEGDSINSHRMAVDVTEHLAIDSKEREYLLYTSCQNSSHNLPVDGSSGDGLKFMFRHIDALADYAFEGSQAGRFVALGVDENGKVDRSAQQEMGGNGCRAKGMDDPHKSQPGEDSIEEHKIAFSWNRATVLPGPVVLAGLNPRWYPWHLHYALR